MSVSASRGHTIVQTKPNVTMADVKQRIQKRQSEIGNPSMLKTWVWGSNSHGQLGGGRIGPGKQDNVPRLLSRALFPPTPHGNEVVEGAGHFAFSKWDDACRCFRQINASLPLKAYVSWDLLQDYLNSVVEADTVSIGLSGNDSIQLAVKRPGYQLDLTVGNGNLSSGIASMLGFRPLRIPASGVFKELSARLSNNVLVYKYFSSKIDIDDSNQGFKYLAFDTGAGTSATFHLSIPPGTYSPEELVAKINALALGNAHSDLLRIDKNPDAFDEQVKIQMPRFGGRKLLGSSLANLRLGFAAALPIDEQYFELGLPNELSELAGTNLLHYRYMPSADSAVREFVIDVGTGIKTLDQVQLAITAGLSRNHNPSFADSFILYMDVNDRVVFEIARDGFQILFSDFSNRTNSLARYLGFAREDFPCAERNLWCATDANSKPECQSPQSDGSPWCAMSAGVLRKRAAQARPLAALHNAHGTCGDGSHVCACRANG